MISVLKEDSGLVYAYMEWAIVDEKGERNNAGHYLYIHHLWIHQNYGGKKTMNEIFMLVDKHEKTKDITGIYWNNMKHKGRLTPLISRERLAREARKGTACFTS